MSPSPIVILPERSTTETDPTVLTEVFMLRSSVQLVRLRPSLARPSRRVYSLLHVDFHAAALSVDELHPIHERADQKQPSPGRTQQVLRIGRIRYRSRIEPLALVAHVRAHPPRGDRKRQVDASPRIERIAVFHGIDDRFANGDADVQRLLLRKAGGFRQSLRDLVGQVDEPYFAREGEL